MSGLSVVVVVVFSCCGVNLNLYIFVVILFIWLSVKPTFDESQCITKSKSWNGNSIRLRCIATGLPAPQISWYKPSNQQITTGVNIVPGGSEITVLTTADQEDYGQYKCRATNIAGSDEHFINVTQLFSPGPVTIKITEVEASSLNIEWIIPADGGGPVIGYLLEVSTRPPVMTVNTHAVITGLKVNTKYTVNVYAKNAVGYGLVSTKAVKTTKIGKPGVPDFLTTLHQTAGSKLSIILRWEEPDSNGNYIIRYTIYMKEVARKAEWAKYDDVTNPNRLEYKITKNIVYGKTYMFMVTAWNKYGESVKDEGSAKILNTTSTKATSFGAGTTSCTEGSKGPMIALGVIIAFLVLSLCFNILQFLFRKRKFQMSSIQERRSQKRTMALKKYDTGESYENDFPLEERVSLSLPNASPARQPVHTAPEYETIQKPHPKDPSTSDTRNYHGLHRLPNTSDQGTHGPVYEPLRRSVEPSMQHNDQHPYEPLNIGNPNTTYQSLQKNTKESAI